MHTYRHIHTHIYIIYLIYIYIYITDLFLTYFVIGLQKVLYIHSFQAVQISGDVFGSHHQLWTHFPFQPSLLWRMIRWHLWLARKWLNPTCSCQCFLGALGQSGKVGARFVGTWEICDDLMMSVSKYIGEDLDTDKGLWKTNEEEIYRTFTKIHATFLGFRREKPSAPLAIHMTRTRKVWARTWCQTWSVLNGSPLHSQMGKWSHLTCALDSIYVSRVADR